MFGAALEGVSAHTGKEEVLEKLRSSLSAVQARMIDPNPTPNPNPNPNPSPTAGAYDRP